MQHQIRVFAILCSLAVAACGGGGGGGGSSEPTGVNDFVSGVQTDGGAVGSPRAGMPPDPSGGPTVTADDEVTIIPGGSVPIDVSADGPFTSVVVSIIDFGPVSSGAQSRGSATGEGQIIDGFFQVDLANAASSVRLELTAPQSLANREFSYRFQVVAPDGRVSLVALTKANRVDVGTGDVQVSIAWDALSDVDLHVIDPFGDEIFFGVPFSESGGVLDLDSNPACAIDGINNENITWPSGAAPRGEYIVRVEYFDSCNVPATNYVVTINFGGRTQTVRGTLTGPGTSGGPGAGTTVATFTF